VVEFRTAAYILAPDFRVSGVWAVLMAICNKIDELLPWNIASGIEPT